MNAKVEIVKVVRLKRQLGTRYRLWVYRTECPECGQSYRSKTTGAWDSPVTARMYLQSRGWPCPACQTLLKNKKAA